MEKTHPSQLLRHSSLSVKVQSFALALCLFSGHISHLSAQVTSFGNDAAFKRVPAPVTLETLQHLRIPQALGSVEEVFQGDSRKAVILIQDAHGVPEAQRSIRKIIGFLQHKFGIELVALEGAASGLDAQFFRSFPDKRRLEEVLEEYLQRGELTGSTAAAILNESRGRYEGIEDWNLYERGLGFYLKAIQQETELLFRVSIRKRELEKQKKSVYSKDLYAFDRVQNAFRNQSLDVISFLERLAGIKRPEKNSQIAFILEETKREKKNPLHSEIKRAAEMIQSYFMTRETGGSGSEKLFHAQYQAYRTSGITAEAFAAFLKDISRKIDEQSPGAVRMPASFFSKSIGRIIENQEKIRNLRGRQFEEELDRYAASVKESLFASEAERKLDRAGGRLDLLEKLIRLELSRKDWRSLKSAGAMAPEDRKGCRWQLAFYRNAEKRERAFYRNLIKKMVPLRGGHSGDVEIAILIAGGFHTKGLTRKFKEKNISYLLMSPAMKSVTVKGYKARMQGDVSWKEYFRVEGGSISIHEAFLRAVRDRLLGRQDMRGQAMGTPAELRSRKYEVRNVRKHSSSARDLLAPVSLVKHWRDQIIRDLANQNRILHVHTYTRFLDELADPPFQNKPSGNGPFIQEIMDKKWVRNIRDFIGAIERIRYGGHSGIAIAYSNMGAWSTYYVLGTDARVNLAAFPKNILQNLFPGYPGRQRLRESKAKDSKGRRSEARISNYEEKKSVLLERLKRLIEMLSEGDDFSVKKPDVFILPGNPHFKPFTEFARLWKEQFTGIPVVLAGGRGRGTRPLIQGVLNHYGEALDFEERKLLEAGLEDESVKETDVLRLVLKKEGIPESFIHQEEIPSSTTGENYKNTREVISRILPPDVRNPAIAIVAAPHLLKRAQVTAVNKWKAETSEGDPERRWQVFRLKTYTPDLSLASDQELVDFVSYLASYPEKYTRLYPALYRWKDRNELKGYYDILGTPPEVRDFSLVESMVTAFSDFLDALNVYYDARENKLIISPVSELRHHRNLIDEELQTAEGILLDAQSMPTRYLYQIEAAMDRMDHAWNVLEGLKNKKLNAHQQEKKNNLISEHDRYRMYLTNRVLAMRSELRMEFVKLPASAGGLTSRAGARHSSSGKGNQDAGFYEILANGVVIAGVFDGYGPAAEASRIVSERVHERLRSLPAGAMDDQVIRHLDEALQDAHQKMLSTFASKFLGGTTAMAAAVYPAKDQTANIYILYGGDSRSYLVENGNKISHLTIDNLSPGRAQALLSPLEVDRRLENTFQRLYGQVGTYAEFEAHPRRDYIRHGIRDSTYVFNTLNTEAPVQLVGTVAKNVRPGWLLLMATDGVYKNLSDAMLLEEIAKMRASGAQKITEAVIDKVQKVAAGQWPEYAWRASGDDATVLVIDSLQRADHPAPQMIETKQAPGGLEENSRPEIRTLAKYLALSQSPAVFDSGHRRLRFEKKFLPLLLKWDPNDLKLLKKKASGYAIYLRRRAIKLENKEPRASVIQWEIQDKNVKKLMMMTDRAIFQLLQNRPDQKVPLAIDYEENIAPYLAQVLSRYSASIRQIIIAQRNVALPAEWTRLKFLHPLRFEPNLNRILRGEEAFAYIHLPQKKLTGALDPRIGVITHRGRIERLDPLTMRALMAFDVFLAMTYGFYGKMSPEYLQHQYPELLAFFSPETLHWQSNGGVMISTVRFEQDLMTDRLTKISA